MTLRFCKKTFTGTFWSLQHVNKCFDSIFRGRQKVPFKKKKKNAQARGGFRIAAFIRALDNLFICRETHGAMCSIFPKINHAITVSVSISLTSVYFYLYYFYCTSSVLYITYMITINTSQCQLFQHPCFSLLWNHITNNLHCTFVSFPF